MGSQDLLRRGRENLNLETGNEKEPVAPPRQQVQSLIFAWILGFRRKPRLAPPQGRKRRVEAS